MNSSQLPRISNPEKEGTLRISKWIKHQILVEIEEMRALMKLLNPYIFITSGIVSEKKASIKQEDFLATYALYINALKEEKIPEESSIRHFFSTIFTRTTEILYAMPIGKDQYLIKPIRPVIQLQMHQFFFSKIDKTFHPMVLGKESISWGIQFSYPQIYQDPQTNDFSKVIDSSDFPNTVLFAIIVKWLRHQTIPTPFIYEGKRTNSPMRLGKNCLKWINRHPQLISQGIQIWESK